MSVKSANLFSHVEIIVSAMHRDFDAYTEGSVITAKIVGEALDDSVKNYKKTGKDAIKEFNNFERDGTGSPEAAQQKFDLTDRFKDLKLTQEIVATAHRDILQTTMAVSNISWVGVKERDVQYHIEDKKGNIYKNLEELNEHLPTSEYKLKISTEIGEIELPLKSLDKNHLKRNTETLKAFADDSGLEDFDKKLLQMFAEKTEEIFGIKELKIGRTK